MTRQTTQAKKRDEEEEDRNDEEEDEEDTCDDEEEDEGAESKASDEDSEDEDDDEEGDDLDSALNDRGGKPSIYIEPWRKKGKAMIWLHRKVKFKKFLRHKWFEIVTYTDRKTREEKSFIRFVNWNCHESADYSRASQDRNDELKRDHHASVCPMDKMIEWVEGEMFAGRIKPEDVVFRFEDGNPEHTIELHAAGLTGIIGLEDCPERWKKQCRQAKVLQDKQKPWNENLNPKGVHCFQVVDDANPSEVKWAVEPYDLYSKIQTAINDEKERSGDDDGDPRKNPYPLLWKFDETVAYGKGNKVITQTKRRPSNKIARLISGPKRTDQIEVIGPGDCRWLRASMENAAQIDMPFDEFFREAKKRGLMSGSVKSQSAKTTPKRDDDEENEPKSDPKPKASSKAASELVKGKSAKTEPEVVNTCDICGEGIGDEDIECGACGTTFDPDNEYHVDGIKCIDCGIVVPLKDASEEDGDLKQICPKCGAVHRLSPSVERFYGELRDKAYNGEVKFAWTMESKPEPKKEVTPKREGRSGRGKASTDSDKLDKKLKGDQVPF